MQAIIVSSREPDAADVPGTLEEEIRVAVMDGYLHRDDGSDDDTPEDEIPEVSRFYEGVPERVADMAYDLVLGGISYHGSKEDLEHDLEEIVTWYQLRLIAVETETDKWRVKRVSDEELDRVYPKWRDGPDPEED